VKIPFFPNTDDGTHCFQAAIKMALSYLLPNRELSYDFLDKVSKKKPGKWTWPTAAIFWMIGEGLTVRLVEEFDYSSFAKKGYDYLVDRYGEAVAKAQRDNSDLPEEAKLASKFRSKDIVEYRSPTIADVEKEIKKGRVVIVNLNAQGLYGLDGYSGHFVVICDVERDGVTLHDPGLPPRPSLRVKYAEFERAWAYPTSRDRNFMSIWKGGHSK
jgi:hypothetical protein